MLGVSHLRCTVRMESLDDSEVCLIPPELPLCSMLSMAPNDKLRGIPQLRDLWLSGPGTRDAWSIRTAVKEHLLHS